MKAEQAASVKTLGRVVSRPRKVNHYGIWRLAKCRLWIAHSYGAKRVHQNLQTLSDNQPAAYAWTVLRSSWAMVIGPIPPGTGVIAAT